MGYCWKRNGRDSDPFDTKIMRPCVWGEQEADVNDVPVTVTVGVAKSLAVGAESTVFWYILL